MPTETADELDLEFEALYRKYFRVVLYFFQARGFVHEDAIDLTQQVFMRAYRFAPSYRGTATPRTWLLRIAAGICVNHLRLARTENRQQTAVPQTADELGDVLPSGKAGQEPLADLREKERLLLGAVGDLTPTQRDIILLRIINEMSIDNIADLLRIRPETVTLELRAARRTLSQKLDRLFAPQLDELF